MAITSIQLLFIVNLAKKTRNLPTF